MESTLEEDVCVQGMKVRGLCAGDEGQGGCVQGMKVRGLCAGGCVQGAVCRG